MVVIFRLPIHIMTTGLCEKKRQEREKRKAARPSPSHTENEMVDQLMALCQTQKTNEFKKKKNENPFVI